MRANASTAASASTVVRSERSSKFRRCSTCCSVCAEGEKMVAVVAPAILGQYNAPTEKVYGAIKAIGFEDVIEVAQGAMETIRNEGAELEEIEEGQAFMTTSCCRFVGRTGQQAYPRDEALHFEHRIADVLRRADRQGETPRRASGLHRPVRSQTQGGTPRRMRRFRDDLRGDQLHFRRPGYRSRNHRSVPHSVRFDPGRPRLRTGRRRDGRRTALPDGQQPAAGRSASRSPT